MVGEHEKRLTIRQSFFMAGREFLTWHHLISDLIVVGQKLEQLGFTYSLGTVLVIDLTEMQ